MKYYLVNDEHVMSETTLYIPVVTLSNGAYVHKIKMNKKDFDGFTKGKEVEEISKETAFEILKEYVQNETYERVKSFSEKIESMKKEEEEFQKTFKMEDLM